MIKIETGQGIVYMYDTYAKSGKTAQIYFGEHEVCKTEAEALEAAELLKAFFEGKAAGKTLQLVEIGVDFATQPDRSFTMSDTGQKFVGGPLSSDMQRPKNTVTDQMNAAQPNGPTFEEFADLCKDAPMNDEPKAHEMESYEAFTRRIWTKGENARIAIAHNATQIFAHGGYTSPAAAVDDAAEIWRLSQQIEL